MELNHLNGTTMLATAPLAEWIKEAYRSMRGYNKCFRALGIAD